jgi:hypothetical protein
VALGFLVTLDFLVFLSTLGSLVFSSDFYFFALRSFSLLWLFDELEEDDDDELDPEEENLLLRLLLLMTIQVTILACPGI